MASVCHTMARSCHTRAGRCGGRFLLGFHVFPATQTRKVVGTQSVIPYLIQTMMPVKIRPAASSSFVIPVSAGLRVLGLIGLILPLVLPLGAAEPAVSYHKDIRPIFQASCHGCHQPAKAKGDYVMTEFAALLKGGESNDGSEGGEPAIVPDKPDESLLVLLITPREGKAEMPGGNKPPLHPTEIEKIRNWISQGAVDDTPANAKVVYSPEQPPSYSQPPLITALDFSPDGKTIAVSGFHEVLLLPVEGPSEKAPAKRLIGMSERIESVAFSPDGSKLAVAGGKPGRMGEVQIWDVAKGALTLSHPVTYDTLYGASWSPDGSKVSFACSDTSVRVIEARSGKQIFFNAAHDDWGLDTVFNNKGDHLISVGRDMAVKSYKLETERFIDNITSITPGALKGGVHAVVSHPLRDAVLFGGADGVPKLYRIFRVKNRQIGDDSNRLLEFPKLTGRIFDIDVNTNATRVAAVSSLNGEGQLKTFAMPATLDTKPVDGILQKPTHQYNADEKKKLAVFFAEQATVKATVDLPDSGGLYAVSLSPDSETVAVGGKDGKVRMYETESGKLVRAFVPVVLE